MKPNQVEAAELIEKNDGRVTLELPTGTGKTAIGYSFLKDMAKMRQGPLFYVVPTKTLVDQVVRLHPDLTPAYGRGEFPCLYYPDQEIRADQIPTILCPGCDHYIDQATGKVNIPGAKPCPYYLQKHQAKQSKIVVCTMAFYLFTQLFSKEWEEPAGLVLDEAHRMAEVVRSVLSYEITDYHLWRACDLLSSIDEDASAKLERFANMMIHIIKRKPAHRGTLLEDFEIRELIELLDEIDTSSLERKLNKAIADHAVDLKAEHEVLKQISVIARDLRRYMRSLEYSVPEKSRQPLNYTYAYYEEEIGEQKKVQHRLVIKAYYVAPIIERILSPRTVAYSATIGNQQVFEYETGIRAPFYTLGSDFPVKNTRIFMPTDTPNLAVKARNRQDRTKVLRRVAKACHTFKKKGHRSLVVVISNEEREKFLLLCEEEKVAALSYGNGKPAKEVAAKFRDGAGDVLVGTVRQYGEGLDLPKQIAPIIFMLRPGYPRPNDPGTQFEERRFTNGNVWAIRNWRVMIEALQVRGRNIRSADDLGVTFFISQQFRRFLLGSLPKWLEEAYQGGFTFEEGIKEAMKVLK
ncbi:MAG: DEAD/DEAH box helicase family protein [Candidatus Kerfeldbacteria bacterium]|nr:DEAD/DEAH box helicase family protein [Candidatus Kerfeldbacteria bacterium]